MGNRSFCWIAFPCVVALAFAAFAKSTDAQPTTKPAAGRCVAMTAATSSQAPPELLGIAASCLDSAQVDQARLYFDLALLYGEFDALRVSDTTAHQAIDVLTLTFTQGLDEPQLLRMSKSQKKAHATQAARDGECANFRRAGYPQYIPRYMSQHGMSAFLGPPAEAAAIDGTESQNRWSDLQASACSMPSPARNGLASSRFSIVGNVVWYTSPSGKSQVNEADASTFEYIGGFFGRDKTHVFYGDTLLPDADARTFRSFDEVTGGDRQHVYHEKDVCNTCDPSTFKVVGEDWYADKNHVYDFRKNGVEPVAEADPQTFAVLNDFIAKDANTVFFWGDVIVGADAPSFALAKCGLSMVSSEDKNRCYWYDHAVPCDCAPHSEADFSGGRRDPVKGKAMVTIYPGNSAGFDFSDKLVSASMNVGALYLAPGTYAIPMECWDRLAMAKKHVLVTTQVEADRFYPISDPDHSCVEGVQPSALLLGRPDNPEIAFPTGGGSTLQTVVPPQTSSIQILCRRVTKTHVLSQAVTLDVQLAPGGIYELAGTFDPGKPCQVQLVKF